MDKDYVSVEEFAAMHGMSVNNVYLILRAEQKLPAEQRRIPGAEKIGGRFRGDWRIPRASAERFERSKRGRKPDSQ